MWSVELEHFNQSWALKEPGVVLLLAAKETSHAFDDITSFPCLNQWVILLACLFLFLAARRNSKLSIIIFLVMIHTCLPKAFVFTHLCASWWVVFLPPPPCQGDFYLADFLWLLLKMLSTFAKEMFVCVLLWHPGAPGAELSPSALSLGQMHGEGSVSTRVCNVCPDVKQWDGNHRIAEP